MFRAPRRETRVWGSPSGLSQYSHRGWAAGGGGRFHIVNEALPGFERPAAEQRVVPRPEGRLVSVQPDITSINRSFTYEVPTAWEEDGRADKVAVGSMVRVDFSGRRTAGWVTAVDVEHDPIVEVRPLAKWSSVGPPADVIELAEWAAWRWAGRVPHFLRVASPPKMVPMVRHAPPAAQVQIDEAYASTFGEGVTTVRTNPADTGLGLALAAAAKGRALILVPTIAWRRRLARQLRDGGVGVAEYDDQWERSASGAVTIGTRIAAFSPMPQVDSVLVLDEHDAAYKSERTPSWNARDVVIERARRAGAPCVLASPSPSLEGLRAADRSLVPTKAASRSAWPNVKVIDLRTQDTPGLLTESIVDVIRSDGPIAAILNRKGRARMLACATCDALAACETCGGSLAETDEGGLICHRDGTTRPKVCSECNGTHLKHLRPGISRLAEDLAVLAKREVIEVSADSAPADLTANGLFIGTEAILHRLEHARAIVFLDFDQELAMPRYRAAEDAFALLALAARLVGPRADGGRIFIQTRRPTDAVVQAAAQGDPGSVARAQRDVRQVFKQPPYGAWALVSGAGAPEFIENAENKLSGEGSGNPDGAVQIRKQDDRWRVSAATHDELLDLINSVERPADRIRIEVDPLDI